MLAELQCHSEHLATPFEPEITWLQATGPFSACTSAPDLPVLLTNLSRLDKSLDTRILSVPQSQKSLDRLLVSRLVAAHPALTYWIIFDL